MRPTTIEKPPSHAVDSRFLKTIRMEETDATPVWLMRQAGRYMSEYRAIREKHSMLEVIGTPELACEVTMQPINTFDLDAAIIFADILPPLMGMGLELDYVKGTGPVIGNAISSTYQIDMLATPPAELTLQSTFDAIKMVKKELESKKLPLLGFAGAPFTLASYAIEGGGSKVYAKTKALMYSEPAAWTRLMDKLVTVQADYLIKQVKAGVDAVQIFDSWAGLALSQYDYNRYIAPFNTKLIKMLSRADVPVINFSTATFAYLEDVAACGGDVIGVDWRMPLHTAWEKIGFDKPIMGNLDPTTLFAPWRELKFRIDQVLDHAAGRPGHVFNLGHGILPGTPVDNVRRLVDYVHERTAKG